MDIFFWLREDRRNRMELAVVAIAMVAGLYVVVTLVQLGDTLVEVVGGHTAPAVVRFTDPIGYEDGHLVVEYQAQGIATPIIAHVLSNATLDDYDPGETIEIVYHSSNPARSTYINTFWGIWGIYWVKVLVSLLIGAAIWFFVVSWRKAQAMGLEENPEADVRIQRGNTLLARGDSAAAIEEYSLALDVIPTPVAYVLRGDAWAHQRDLAAALRDYRKAAQIYKYMDRPEDVATVERRINAATILRARLKA